MSPPLRGDLLPSAPDAPSPYLRPESPFDILVVGMSTLVDAWALAYLLSESGVPARADIGQQGMPATVWVDLPPARRRECRAIVLAAAHALDPASRRLVLRAQRGRSVRLSALRLGSSSASSRPADEDHRGPR